VTPKIFVGTMYCGEGDLPECLEAVLSQKDVSVKQIIIRDMQEKAAHNALWAAWREAKCSHDLFVKVDADTVLAHDGVLRSFWDLFQSNPRITGAQAPLNDYFTAGRINGLNCFSPKVTFRDTTDELFCDRQVDVDHDVVIRSDQVGDALQPAGYHCYRANDAQAFHFGLHRALKRQVNTIAQVRQAYKREGGRPRALALIGAQMSPNFAAGGFNYSDERFKVALDGVVRRFEELVKDL